MSMRARNAKSRVRNTWRWVGLTVFIGFPYGAVLVAHEDEWIGRVIALSVVFVSAVVLSLWYSMNPRTSMIREGGRLSGTEFAKQKRLVEGVLRVAILGFGLSLLFMVAVPFAGDVVSLATGERPETLQGRVARNTSAFGAWFVSQSIGFQGGEEAEGTYYLLYSLAPRLRRDAVYEVLVLPRSRMIVEASLAANEGRRGRD